MYHESVGKLRRGGGGGREPMTYSVDDIIPTIDKKARPRYASRLLQSPPNHFHTTPHNHITVAPTNTSPNDYRRDCT